MVYVPRGVLQGVQGPDPRMGYVPRGMASGWIPSIRRILLQLHRPWLGDDVYDPEATVDAKSQMRTLGKPVRPFQSVQRMLAKLQDQRGIDQPLPSILGMGEEREQTKLVLPQARADPARRSKTTQTRL